MELPTYSNIVSFIKNNKKIIISTIVSVLFIYGLAIAYNIYTEAKVDNLTTEDPLGVSGNNSNLLLKNNKDAVRSIYYIENNQDVVFTNFKLLNQILTDKKVLNKLDDKEKIDELIEQNYELFDIINVFFDNTNNTLILSVSTGNYKSNMSIINALHVYLTSGEIEMFNDKNIYSLSEPKKASNSSLSETAINTTNGNPVRHYIVPSLLILFLSPLLGLAVAVIKNLFNSNIDELYRVNLGLKEKIIALNEIANDDELKGQLGHLISHPQVPQKLILSDSLDMLKEFNFDIDNKKEWTYSRNLVDVDTRINFDEIIILLFKNKTEKKWLKDQVALLKNYDSDIKIIII